MIPVYLRLTPRAGGDDQGQWISSVTTTSIRRGNEEHAFRRVFQDSTQTEVYEACMAPLVQDFLSGSNTSFFTLGATGSGKTYTVVGTADQPGVIWRSLEDIFAMGPIQINIAMFELYNDKFFDLLDADGNGQAGRRMLLLKSSSSGFVIDAQRRGVASVRKAIEAIYAGYSRRTAHATNCNEHSSRSHAFVLIEYGGASMVIADLAGSERLNDAGSVGAQRIEAGEINKSLMMLGQALQQLRHGGGSPMRTSKLCRVLLHGGLGSDPVMLVTLDPYKNQSPGLQILRYASTATQIRTRPGTSATTASHGGTTSASIASASTPLAAVRGEAQLRRKLYAIMDSKLAALSDSIFA